MAPKVKSIPSKDFKSAAPESSITKKKKKRSVKSRTGLRFISTIKKLNTEAAHAIEGNSDRISKTALAAMAGIIEHTIHRICAKEAVMRNASRKTRNTPKTTSSNQIWAAIIAEFDPKTPEFDNMCAPIIEKKLAMDNKTDIVDADVQEAEENEGDDVRQDDEEEDEE